MAEAKWEAELKATVIHDKGMYLWQGIGTARAESPSGVIEAEVGTIVGGVGILLHIPEYGFFHVNGEHIVHAAMQAIGQAIINNEVQPLAPKRRN